MKQIAVITGATGGLGKEFVKAILKEDVDEIWAVARNKDKLESLCQEYGERIVPISKDLTDKDDLHSLGFLLQEKNPHIKYLINNAGIGKMGTYKDFTLEETEKLLNINCNAVALMCVMCLPYIGNGGHILNISSQASFQPNPYLNLYAATKAFVTSYSRSLNREARGHGITVTAVCPGWVNTELLKREWNGKTIKFPGIVEAEPVVRKALSDAKSGKDMSVYGGYVKFMRVFSKLMPHKVVMDLWIRSIKQYEK